jgi:hypothetical protein
LLSSLSFIIKLSYFTIEIYIYISNGIAILLIDFLKSIEELELCCISFINEGGLVIKWGRKLKNKGNAVITFKCETA